MLKKDYDKQKKAAKIAAAISIACEGADDATLQQSAIMSTEIEPLSNTPVKYLMMGTAIAIFLLVIVV